MGDRGGAPPGRKAAHPPGSKGDIEMELRNPLLAASAALVLCAGLSCAKPARIEASPKELVLRDPGASKTLTVTVLDEKDNAIEKAKLTYVSASPDVAEVDAEGKVTARASGDATITVKSGEVSTEVPVRVRILSRLELRAPELGAVGPSGAVVPLTVTAVTDRGDPGDLGEVTFTSSNPQVASVDGSGCLTVLSPGRVKITAESGKTRAEVETDVIVESPVAVKVDEPNQTVPLGGSAPLRFTVISDQGRPMQTAVQFEVNPDKHLAVDPQGVASGLARGTAAVTVHAGPAKNSIRVTVR
jgi:hypothetical protein